MRMTEHPILDVEERADIHFSFDGKEFCGKEGDTIASALHAAGVRVFGRHWATGRPRGFYCAIGNCSSCLMIVDGKANVRVCVEALKEGMDVRSQEDRGRL